MLLLNVLNVLACTQKRRTTVTKMTIQLLERISDLDEMVRKVSGDATIDTSAYVTGFDYDAPTYVHGHCGYY